MREIKFRGKRIDNGKWISGYLFAQGGKAYIITDLTPVGFIKHEVDPATVGQYAGLHDKEGKEIFEGDILVLVAERAEQVFLSAGWEAIDPRFCSIIAMSYNIGECAFGFCRPSEAMDANPDIGALAIHNRCRIIGNIHDNPELLKGV